MSILSVSTRGGKPPHCCKNFATGTQNRTSLSYNRRISDYDKKQFLAPGFRRRLSSMPVRPKTLLRFLLGKWKYQYLTWGEFEIMRELCRVLRKEPGVGSLLQLMDSNKFEYLFERWLNHIQASDAKNCNKVLDALYSNHSRARIPSYRNWKGIRLDWRHLEFFLQKKAPQTGKLNVKRERIRGYRDKGSLPDNPIARLVDYEGGQLLHEEAEKERNSSPTFAEKVSIENQTHVPARWFSLLVYLGLD